MAQEINLGGTIYVSSKRAAEITGYAQDYIGQLARSGQIEARRVAGLWYVLEDSLRNHKHKADEFTPTPPTRVAPAAVEASVSFDGNEYISASRAAKITGYSQDYVGQLARANKIPSRQIGTRWYVDRAAISEHKRHNDSLLGAIQAESVGIMRTDPSESLKIDTGATEASEPHFQYIAEEVPPMPTAAVEDPVVAAEPTALEDIAGSGRQIPIRVVAAPVIDEPQEYMSRDRAVTTSNTATTSRITMFFIAFLGIIIFGAGVVTFIGIPNMPGSSSIVGAANMPQISISTDKLAAAAGGVSEIAGKLLAKELEYRRSN